MIKIAIEARVLTARGAGVKTYTKELLTHLQPYKNQAEIGVICAGEEESLVRDLGFRTIAVPLRHPWQVLTNSWLNRDVQRALTSFQPNVVHYTKAAVPSRSAYPVVVSIYDVIPLLLPQSQNLAARYYWPSALRQAARISDHILTISQASKRDIVKYLRVPADKVTVTPLAVDTDFFTPQPAAKVDAVLAQLGISKPYILCLATRDMRKNIASLIKAFASVADEFPHTLIIAGKQALRHDKSDKLVTAMDLTSRIKFLDFVPLEHLPSLYSGAELFVWPSIYEGWGVPVLEAMACGVPAIVSNGGALPEVAGQAAETVAFSTDDLIDRLSDKVFQAQLVERMRLVLSSKDKQAAMRASGLTHVHSFSWDRAAQATWDVYKKIAV